VPVGTRENPVAPGVCSHPDSDSRAGHPLDRVDRNKVIGGLVRDR